MNGSSEVAFRVPKEDRNLYIGRDIGLTYPAVRNIIARYEEKGAESLVPGKKGRKKRDKRALSEEQEAQNR